MIRQSVSCDICGTEKRQTNHWFVAHEQAGELRLCGWNSRYRSRAGSKHLCGQTCLHKLVDEFMARSLSARQSGESPAAERPPATDASLTAKAAYDDAESSARLLAPLLPATSPAPMLAAPGARAETAAHFPIESAAGVPMDEVPDRPAPKRRAEAWQRERDRTVLG